jgi:alginate O-acetyltransferase complex protein AlgI
LLLLPLAFFPVRDAVPAWMFMWMMAGSLFFGSKWLTLRRALRSGARPPMLGSLGYAFAWPGMEAEEFLENKKSKAENRKQKWLAACAKTLSGGLLLWTSVRSGLRHAWLGPLATGWLGMAGLVIVLHFGLFQLLALAWQRAGVNAQPIMQAPLTAVSLSDFWSRRWNTAFNKLAHDLAFRPLARRFGARGGMLGVFLISGLVHELVISVPARGGYGLPTVYFALQAFGVLIERSAWGRRVGLGHGLRGGFFMVAFTAGPVFWLFHPIFVRIVILPMLGVTGTT